MQIEKNIPIPPRKHGNLRYPWREMEVGDSFLVTGKIAKNFSGQCSSASYIYKPKKFICAPVDNGVRVWRTE